MLYCDFKSRKRSCPTLLAEEAMKHADSVCVGYAAAFVLARDRIVEDWLINQVGAAYDALAADPSRALTVDQVRVRLAAEHEKMK